MQTQHTPGAGCSFIDLYVTKTGQTNAVVSATTPTLQTYVITYGNNRVAATGGTLTDMLPTAMSYRADLSSSSPALAAQPSPAVHAPSSCGTCPPCRQVRQATSR